MDLDGQPIATIVSPPGEGRAQLTQLNFAHPLLLAVNDPDNGERTAKLRLRTNPNRKGRTRIFASIGIGALGRNQYFVLYRKPDQIVIRSRCISDEGFAFMAHNDLVVPLPEMRGRLRA